MLLLLLGLLLALHLLDIALLMRLLLPLVEPLLLAVKVDDGVARLSILELLLLLIDFHKSLVHLVGLDDYVFLERDPTRFQELSCRHFLVETLVFVAHAPFYPVIGKIARDFLHLVTRFGLRRLLVFVYIVRHNVRCFEALNTVFGLLELGVTFLLVLLVRNFDRFHQMMLVRDQVLILDELRVHLACVLPWAAGLHLNKYFIFVTVRVVWVNCWESKGS